MAMAEHTRTFTTQKSALFALYKEHSALLYADGDTFERIMEIEAEAAMMVPETVDEFALKVLIADAGGDMRANSSLVALLDMAHQIVAGDPVVPMALTKSVQ